MAIITITEGTNSIRFVSDNPTGERAVNVTMQKGSGHYEQVVNATEADSQVIIYREGKLVCGEKWGNYRDSLGAAYASRAALVTALESFFFRSLTSSISALSGTYAYWANEATNDRLVVNANVMITDKADAGVQLTAVSPNKFSLQGTGIFYNPDYNGNGVYGGVLAITGRTAGSQQGIWHTTKESILVTYTPVSGAFAVGDTVFDLITGASGVVTYIVDASNMYVRETTPGFAAPNGIDDGGSTSGTMTAVVQPQIAQDDIVIYNGLHYQCVSFGNTNGINPATNAVAYTVLPKALDTGYIEEQDAIQFDFNTGKIIARWDDRSNYVVGSAALEASAGTTSLETFQWGNANCVGNVIYGLVDIRNHPLSTYSNNEVQQFAVFSPVDALNGIFDGNILETKSIWSNVTYTNNVTMEGTVIQGEYSSARTIDYNISGKRCTTQGSNIAVTLNGVLNGSTELDLQQYPHVGVFYIQTDASLPVTENLNTVVNPPAFRFRVENMQSGYTIQVNKATPVTAPAVGGILNSSAIVQVQGDRAEGVGLEATVVNATACVRVLEPTYSYV